MKCIIMCILLFQFGISYSQEVDVSFVKTLTLFPETTDHSCASLSIAKNINSFKYTIGYGFMFKKAQENQFVNKTNDSVINLSKYILKAGARYEIKFLNKTTFELGPEFRYCVEKVEFTGRVLNWYADTQVRYVELGVPLILKYKKIARSNIDLYFLTDLIYSHPTNYFPEDFIKTSYLGKQIYMEIGFGVVLLLK